MKKGFTLVEIILSIGLIVVIGTISLVSFNLIKKQSKTNTLENMSDEILRAVNVYVETNSGIKNELYENKNGLVIPLTTLEKSGLIDFNGLNLDDEKDYVVTMLGSSEEGVDYCAETYTAKSWSIKDEVVYICEKSDGTKNLVTVAGEADNLSKSTRDVYYFRGGYVTNYAKLNGKSYRIFSIDKDDSLVIVGSSSDISAISNNLLEPVSCGSDVTLSSKDAICEEGIIKNSFSMSSAVSSCPVSSQDALLSGFCDLLENSFLLNGSGSSSAWFAYSYRLKVDSWLCSDLQTIQDDKETLNSKKRPDRDVYTPINYYDYNIISFSCDSDTKKAHLNSCVKITSGTGDVANPYILDSTKCS